MSHFVAPMPPKPWRGTDNLRCYLFEATLPNMPTSSTVPWTPEGHKTHLNVLKVRHERYRRFYGIQSLDPIEFDDLVAEWMDQYIPSQPLRAADRDEKTGARLTIPAPEFSIEWPEKRKPTSISSIHTWIDELPLETAQRAAQLAFPSLRQHEFVPNGEADPADHEIFNYFLWSDPLAESPFGNVVVVYQPPWILSLHDLKCFCNKQTFPSFPTGHGSKPLDSSERLWGKIWDLCVRKGTPWFVVSTYMGWVFGAFSAGWTKAWVSPIKEFDAYDPSVIQCLVYWLAAAGGLKGCWEIPKVCSEPKYTPTEFSCTVYDVFRYKPAAVLALARLS
ncbi:hypothetical protein PLICRDRAFT_627362 [Plicaturopsis crispa FD-325 SS-3]|nr:hypothetical protein PLICRDRAFT_627362 [Plicaturopsis crispa FD-325 SS-3]